MSELDILKTVDKGVIDREGSKELTGYPHIDRPWMKYYNSEFAMQPSPEMDIYDYVKYNNKNNEEMTAISYYGNRVSYGELTGHVDDASKVLSEVGVKEDDRVMYLMACTPETAYLMYGGSQIGAVADYIDPRPDSLDLRVSAEKVLATFDRENAKYLVALDRCYLGMLKPVENELKERGVENIILVSATDSMTGLGTANYLHDTLRLEGFKGVREKLKQTKKYAEMLEACKASSPIKLLNYRDLVKDCRAATFTKVPYKKNRLAVITHTSGTSSPIPKPIPLTNDNLNAYAHQTFGANMPMEKTDRVLHTLPYFAAFGLVDEAHAGLCHGNNLIQIPEFSPNNIGKLLLINKPQTVIGPPTIFLAILKDPALKNADLSFLKMVTYGGEGMDIKDEEAINKFLADHGASCKITKGHGMSESCGCATFATGDYNELGSIGIPMPNTVYGFVDPETKELLKFDKDKDYIEGEFIVSSEAVTSGVLDDDIIVPHATYDGLDFIYTRDIGKMNKDGIMTFLSRSDRSFARADGFKIKPYEVEGVLKEDPRVKYAIVVPYYDEKQFGNMAIAHVVLEDDLGLDTEEQIRITREIVDNCFTNNKDVSTRQIPSKFRYRSDIPITANGKIDVNSIINEGLSGDEISVTLSESNISVDDITISADKKDKTKVLKDKR